MTTTKKHVAAKVRLTLTLDPALHKIILEESAKMFMLPTKWVEFCIVTKTQVQHNQKTSLTNLKSKPDPAPEVPRRRTPEEQHELEERLREESRAEWEAMLARRGQE